MKRFFILLLIVKAVLFAQKKTLDHSVYENWKILQKSIISNDGNWVSYEINPQKGDGFLYIYDRKNALLDSFSRGYDAIITPNSKYIVFKVKPQEKLLRKLKLNKTKNDDLPKDSLFIYNLLDKSLKKYPDVIDLQVSTEYGALLGFRQSIKDTTKKTNKKELFKDIKKYNLNVIDLTNNNEFHYGNVDNFYISKNGNYFAFTQFIKDSTSAFFVNTNEDNSIKLFNDFGFIRSITIDNSGQKIAFVHTNDTSKVKRYKLYISNLKELKVLIDTVLPDKNLVYEINPNKNLEFSDNSQKLYFYISEKKWPEPIDTLLEEEKYKVDVWNWLDDRLQTQQLNELKNDKEKSYICVYDFTKDKYFQLEDSIIQYVKRYNKGDSDFYLGISTKPYWRIFSWVEADYKDIYYINLNDNKKEKILQKIEFSVSLSPKGNYLLYYNTDNKSYMIYNIKENKNYEILTSKPYPLFDEEFDKPKTPEPYGFADWDINENYVLIYDKYDIYKVSPTNSFKPINITNGRKYKIKYRYIRVEQEDFIKNNFIFTKSTSDDYLTEAYNLIDLDSNSKVKLLEDKAALSKIIKSKNSPFLLFSKSSYQLYPDIILTDTTFKNTIKISNTNPQMKNYLWGTVEIFKWKNKKGKEFKGLLYKPENFDPKVKYPAIVYFYEKYTPDIHRHYIPAPSRSVINFPLFNSNGYIIFIPDITYKIGDPGKSATEIVVNGTKELIKLGFVDKNKIGLQGQSWGGYQTAYIITQTDIFQAAMAGAPVSNMTSAYGGIRWESGVNRIFQYEQGQSRIGGTLWDKLNKYIENSPLFFANKIKTPLLIMANDNDGAVPYQEGIQYFVALRRLNKPVWLLNYNGDAHNLLKWPNRVDLSIRMLQFFDHFLKDAPAPVWMKEGIPAIKKGKFSGYEIK